MELFVLQQHRSSMSDSEDLFDEGVPLNIDPSPTSLGSTPFEFRATVGTSSSSSLQLPQKTVESREDGRTVYVCPECQKDLKSKSGFTRHMMRHKLDGMYWYFFVILVGENMYFIIYFFVNLILLCVLLRLCFSYPLGRWNWASATTFFSRSFGHYKSWANSFYIKSVLGS